jgi:hypothetical protein
MLISGRQAGGFSGGHRPPLQETQRAGELYRFSSAPNCRAAILVAGLKLAAKIAALQFLNRENSAPVGIRTSNLLIRSQMLYPVELRAPEKR